MFAVGCCWMLVVGCWSLAVGCWFVNECIVAGNCFFFGGWIESGIPYLIINLPSFRRLHEVSLSFDFYCFGRPDHNNAKATRRCRNCAERPAQPGQTPASHNHDGPYFPSRRKCDISFPARSRHNFNLITSHIGITATRPLLSPSDDGV